MILKNKTEPLNMKLSIWQASIFQYSYPSQKEIHLPTIHFQGLNGYVTFREGIFVAHFWTFSASTAEGISEVLQTFNKPLSFTSTSRSPSMSQQTGDLIL